MDKRISGFDLVWANKLRKAIAKSKAKELKDKAGELVNYAKEKATPVLQSAAEQVREKTISVTKEVLNKLEKKD